MNMKKYIALGNCNINGELWFLVDAASSEQAKQIIADAEDKTFEISACVEVTANPDEGISHKFTLFE